MNEALRNIINALTNPANSGPPLPETYLVNPTEQDLMGLNPDGRADHFVDRATGQEVVVFRGVAVSEPPVTP